MYVRLNVFLTYVLYRLCTALNSLLKTHVRSEPLTTTFLEIGSWQMQSGYKDTTDWCPYKKTEI